jgi:transcription elongation factor Elf1
MNAKQFIKQFRKRLKQIINLRFFCGHIQWIKTGNKIGVNLNEHKCIKCGKKIYKDSFNPPISYIF